MSIPPDYKSSWKFFNSRAKIEGMTPAELLRDIIDAYLEDYEAERLEAEEELDEIAPLRDKVPKKVKVKKSVKPKRKSFLARKATITKKREEPEPEDITIQDTPKFRFLELVRSLDDGEGIDPDILATAAGEEGIAHPRLQMNKMIRRGILYIHEGKVQVT
tara:strand:+ start:265 stop:747 length:483 start_codon:yes stop_codon:yes gene_type:complete